MESLSSGTRIFQVVMLSGFVLIIQKLNRAAAFLTRLYVRPTKTHISLHMRTVFAGQSLGSRGFKASSCGQQRVRSDCAGAHGDLNLD